MSYVPSIVPGHLHEGLLWILRSTIYWCKDEETSEDFPGVVQWLRFCVAIQAAWVQSLMRELRSHMPCSQRKKIKDEETGVREVGKYTYAHTTEKWQEVIEQGSGKVLLTTSLSSDSALAPLHSSQQPFRSGITVTSGDPFKQLK